MLKKVIAKGIADIADIMAELGVGSASIAGMYQPAEAESVRRIAKQRKQSKQQKRVRK